MKFISSMPPMVWTLALLTFVYLICIPIYRIHIKNIGDRTPTALSGDLIMFFDLYSERTLLAHIFLSAKKLNPAFEVCIKSITRRLVERSMDAITLINFSDHERTQLERFLMKVSFDGSPVLNTMFYQSLALHLAKVFESPNYSMRIKMFEEGYPSQKLKNRIAIVKRETDALIFLDRTVRPYCTFPVLTRLISLGQEMYNNLLWQNEYNQETRSIETVCQTIEKMYESTPTYLAAVNYYNSLVKKNIHSQDLIDAVKAS